METDRRTFIKTSAVLSTGLVWHKTGAHALIPAVQGFELPPLGYAFDALEPYIDAQTMQIHHDKHHQAYITKLNDAITAEPTLAGKSLDELIGNLNSCPEKVRMAIRNHGGGHWNHSFFWRLLKTGTSANGKLKEAILRDFGSMENFTTAFEKAALGQFGSGWAWLVSRNGKLSVQSSPNQDNPLMDTSQGKTVPVIGLDVWEHAYYLKYQNKRGDYAKAFWNVLNWEEAEKNYLNG
jgi:Fe-Mn family superoxide dismutase